MWSKEYACMRQVTDAESSLAVFISCRNVDDSYAFVTLSIHTSVNDPRVGVVRQISCCQLCRSTNVSCVHHLGFLRIPSLMLACCYCTMVKLTSTQPQCFHICSWALTDFPQQKNISGCSSSLFDSSKHVLVSPQTLHTNHCTHLLILVYAGG